MSINAPKLALICIVTMVAVAASFYIANSILNPKNPKKSADVGKVHTDRYEVPSHDPVLSDPPNIVLIYADDIDCESIFGAWPEQPTDSIQFPTIKKLAEEGMRFTNFHVTTPVCGPSRACLLSSQYAHRSRVCINTENTENANGFTGGYRKFDRKDEFGVWMQKAGYETSWVGKYLHDGFSPQEGSDESWASIKPPGWQNFLGSLGGGYFKFGTADCEAHGTETILDEYRTDHEVDSVCRMLQEYKQRDSGKPLVLCWAPFAAHLSYEPKISADRHQGMFKNATYTNYPQEIENGDFVDESEKYPGTFQLPVFDKAEIKLWQDKQRDRLRAIQALDEGLAKIIAQVKKNGDYEKTIFVFTSDHGFSLGQSRHFGKRLPRDRVTKVPMIIAGPGIPKNQTCDQLLANIDIGPTLTELAGGKAGPNVDGISFARLLKGPKATMPRKRTGIVIENWDRIAIRFNIFDLTYSALRTDEHLYCEWANGITELFDVRQDPEQRSNLFDKASAEDKDRWATDLRQAHRTNNTPFISKVFNMDERYLKYGLAATFEPVRFSGLVEDDAGIASVELELSDADNKQFWDGENWSDEATTVRAKLAQPNGVLTRWTYALSNRELSIGSDKPLKKRTVHVKVIARDGDDNQAEWSNAASFSFRPDDPETWVDNDQVWQPREKPFTVSGRAADDDKVKRIEILVRDTDNKKFWNGKEWTEERVLLPVTTSEPIETDDSGRGQSNADGGDWVRWTYTFDGPQTGEIFICARAFDQSENWDDSVPFTIIPTTNKYPNRK